MTSLLLCGASTICDTGLATIGPRVLTAASSGVSPVAPVADAAASTSALPSPQYEMTATDPVSVVLLITLLTVTALLACWRPAEQAVGADPVRLLRED